MFSPPGQCKSYTSGRPRLIYFRSRDPKIRSFFSQSFRAPPSQNVSRLNDGGFQARLTFIGLLVPHVFTLFRQYTPQTTCTCRATSVRILGCSVLPCGLFSSAEHLGKVATIHHPCTHRFLRGTWGFIAQPHYNVIYV